MFEGSGRRARTVPGSLRPNGSSYSFPSSPLPPCYRMRWARSRSGWCPGRRSRGWRSGRGGWWCGSWPRRRRPSGGWARRGEDSCPLPVRGRRCYGPSTMPRESLTAKELEELRASLERERSELQSQLNEIETSTFSQNQSDLSGETAFDDEYADAGTATFERERDLSLENNVRDLLGKIEKALTRMDEGTYGTCERCGRPIEKARLKALPYANLCIADAQAATRPR